MKLKTFFILACGFILALSAISCSKEKESRNNGNSKAETSETSPDVDTSKPSKVANAAW